LTVFCNYDIKVSSKFVSFQTKFRRKKMETGMIKKRFEAKVAVGDILEMRVYINSKDHLPGFIPWAVEDDDLLYATTGDDNLFKFFRAPAKSIRFFIITNPKNLQDGEDWRVKVVKLTIGQGPKSVSKDGRRYIFIELEILERAEVKKEYFDYSNKEYVVRIESGSLIISDQRFSVEERVEKLRCQGFVVWVKEFIYQGNIVESNVAEEKTEQDYLKEVRQALGKSAPRNIAVLLKTIREVESRDKVVRNLDQIV